MEIDWIELAESYGFSAVVLLVGLWLMWRLRHSLARQERLGQERLAARGSIMAVPTVRARRPTEDVKQRGARSIEARFTVHRRLLLPLAGATTLCLAALPFLDRVPSRRSR